LEESGRGLNKVLFSHLVRVTEEDAGVPIEVRIEPTCGHPLHMRSVRKVSICPVIVQNTNIFIEMSSLVKVFISSPT
jgi:hypothetical protein